MPLVRNNGEPIDRSRTPSASGPGTAAGAAPPGRNAVGGLLRRARKERGESVQGVARQLDVYKRQGMRSHAGIAAQMFRALADKGINIQVITTSEIKVSVLIEEAYAELAARTLHTIYGLDAA